MCCRHSLSRRERIVGANKKASALVHSHSTRSHIENRLIAFYALFLAHMVHNSYTAISIHLSNTHSEHSGYSVEIIGWNGFCIHLFWCAFLLYMHVAQLDNLTYHKHMDFLFKIILSFFSSDKKSIIFFVFHTFNLSPFAKFQ